MKKKLLFIVSLIIFFSFNVNAQSSTKIESKVIYVYGSPDCHYCIKAKELLTENKIQFIFRDIDNDKEALAEMLAKLKAANLSTHNLGIPVIDKYGELFTNNGDFDDFLKKLIQ